MQSSTRKRTVAKKRVTTAKGISALRLKWCDITDWWDYDIKSKHRKCIITLALIAVLLLGVVFL